jgi:hypothetical protein
MTALARRTRRAYASTMSRIALGVAMAVAALLVSGGAAQAELRPTVVELFTSQGCSSCPPADALLGELAKRSDVIALAYHVDYWNNLGWKDMYSSAAATQRQYTYGRALKLDGVYTPQMVIEGTEDVIGSRRGAVLSMIGGKHDGVPVKAVREGKEIVVRVGKSGGGAQVTKAAATDAKAGDVVVVAYSDAAETKVPRGENAGETLHEFNIVRGFWVLGAWNGGAQELRFDSVKLPQGATRLALLVQAPGQGAILGASTQAIP